MLEQMIIGFISTSIALSTPLLLGAIGEVFAERSGVMNLGVEGMMIMGALSGFLVLAITGDPWTATILATLVGGLVSLIHAILSISLRANQLLSGLALTMFGLGVSGFLGQPLLGVSAKGLPVIPIPLLDQIPYLGEILFQHDPITYISYLLVPIAWVALFKTEFGLTVRAVGEDPAAADAVGINVYRTRYICVFVGGLLAGLAGAFLSVAYARMWVEGMTAGRGWIVIVITIFSMWNPARAVVGAFLFGAVTTLTYMFQGMGVALPAEVLLMTPYLFTIAILLIVSQEAMRKRIRPPTGLYKPYVREER